MSTKRWFLGLIIFKHRERGRGKGDVCKFGRNYSF